jgi:hypothetical protein
LHALKKYDTNGATLEYTPAPVAILPKKAQFNLRSFVGANKTIGGRENCVPAFISANGLTDRSYSNQ